MAALALSAMLWVTLGWFAFECRNRRVAQVACWLAILLAAAGTAIAAHWWDKAIDVVVLLLAMAELRNRSRS